jgi:hypothetical protein
MNFTTGTSASQPGRVYETSLTFEQLSHLVTGHDVVPLKAVVKVCPASTQVDGLRL